MGLLKQIFGICSTVKPGNENCWSYTGGKIEIDLKRSPELAGKGGAMRLEGKGLPMKVMMFHGDDGNYYALKNKCSHIGGRRIDPVGGTETIKCCSVMGSTYKYTGEVISGPAKTPLKTFAVEKQDEKLIVSLE